MKVSKDQPGTKSKKLNKTLEYLIMTIKINRYQKE